MAAIASSPVSPGPRLAQLSRMSTPAPILTDLTLVLGPPLHDRAPFDAFQSLASRGDGVTEHEWVRHELAAIDALTARDGAISRHTLLETMVGSVLRVAVIIADVDRQWVRHADGQLYAALSFNTEDVRPRAASLALQQPGSVEALQEVAVPLATLDGREWLAWSSRSWQGHATAEQTQRTATLMARIADAVLAASPGASTAEAEPRLELLDDLLCAIRLGRDHADRPQLPLAQELRALRHRDPLRHEWQRLTMDAVFLAAQPTDRVHAEGAAGLAYLYLDRERVQRLKADPFITPRDRGEIAARTFMTAYALHRLAPVVSETLLAVMTERR